MKQDKIIPTLVKQLGEQLLKQHQTCSIAESCTGGGLAAAITELAGCSQWFECGYVTYSNQAKQQMLAVPQATLDAFGAVSKETALAMATGAQTKSKANLCVAITGIAGPGGGSNEKPVGTVWIAWVSDHLPSRAELFFFTGNRTEIRTQAIEAALNGLIELSRLIEASNASTTNLNAQQYHALYTQAQMNPEQFWSEQAKRFITWYSPWIKAAPKELSQFEGTWFDQGKLNACYNCVDRHLQTRPHQTAIIYEGNSPNETQTLTYAQLYENINRFANVLKQHNIHKGDRVCIYLPMIPEAVIAMLACARIGAIHSVVFAGFSAEALKNRILDADCRLVITADHSMRGEKIIPLKQNCDLALQDCPKVNHLIVIQRTNHDISWQPKRDVWYHQVMKTADTICPAETMDASDPLFILYTSGSTGKPKGIVHNTGGYLVYAAMTHHYVFDYQDQDIHWCTADIGWITGHSYVVYGPLLNGATTLLFDGTPNYPSYARYWELIDKHQVNIFYTAPTALRTLRREGDDWVKKTHRSSLKRLGTVGEPINPEVWEWYYHVVGETRCPIVNTWWQTETGGILLTPFPGVSPLLPGSVGLPFFGIEPDIIDGTLIIKKSWPGLMQTIFGDQKRYDACFGINQDHTSRYYITSDGAYHDQNGNYWITGRDDDVIKVSGHRLGSEELESALMTHPNVAEAAVVGVPHPIKGESMHAFISLKVSAQATEALKSKITQHLRDKIGPLATLEAIYWTPILPKTRSGKVMRRILRKLANRELDNLGDISTLSEPSVIETIITELTKEVRLI